MQPPWGQEYTAVVSPLLTETSEASSVAEVDVGAFVPVACLSEMNSPRENDGYVTSYPGVQHGKNKELLLAIVLLFLAHRLSGNNPPFALYGNKMPCQKLQHSKVFTTEQTFTPKIYLVKN